MTVYAEDLLSRRAAVGRIALWTLWLGAAALAPGCRQSATPLVRAGTYGDTPEELHRLWSAILAACQSDERGRVHDLLASLIMTRDELAGISFVAQSRARVRQLDRPSWTAVTALSTWG